MGIGKCRRTVLRDGLCVNAEQLGESGTEERKDAPALGIFMILVKGRRQVLDQPQQSLVSMTGFKG